MSTNLIQLNVLKALEKIGKTNGTALPEAEPPENINDKDNWQKQRGATFELMIAQQIASYADKRVEKAKSITRQMFDDEISQIKPGTSNTVVTGNVALNVEVRRSPSRLDRGKLVSALAKRNITMDEIEKILIEGSTETKAPTYFKPSIVS